MRLYRYLLRTLPRDLRDQFGADMEQLLRDRLEDTESRRARAVLYAGAIVDVLRVAVAARVPRHIAGTPVALKRPIGDLPMDIRLATRALVRNPTYSVAAVLTLAVGIGTATAFFSVVNAVLLRPLPFRDADRLVSIFYEYLTPEIIDEVQRSRSWSRPCRSRAEASA
jgi:putative ABC transport system permease protein